MTERFSSPSQHVRGPMGGATFCFVSPDAFLLPTRHGERACDLALYHITETHLQNRDDEPTQNKRLHVAALFSLDGSSQVERSSAHYAPPHLNPIGSRPRIAAPPHQSHAHDTDIPAPASLPSPYETTAENSFLCLEYDFFIINGEHQLRLYVPRSAFLRYLLRLVSSEDPYDTSETPAPTSLRRIPWEEWGRPYARRPHDDFHISNPSPIYGSRQAFFERRTGLLTVMDFNLSIRRLRIALAGPSFTGLYNDGSEGVQQLWSNHDEGGRPSGSTFAVSPSGRSNDGDATTTYAVRRKLTSARREERWVANVLCDRRRTLKESHRA